MIFDLAQIEAEIKRKFTDELIDTFGYRFRRSTLSEERLDALEERLGVRLPPLFRATIGQLDLMHFSLGHIEFGGGEPLEDYADYLEAENTGDRGWWGEGKRPDHLLLIGGTDLYDLLLDTSNDRLLAFTEGKWEHAMPVAPDIETLLRAVGTLLVTRGSALDEVLSELANSMGGVVDKGFWRSR